MKASSRAYCTLLCMYTQFAFYLISIVFLFTLPPLFNLLLIDMTHNPQFIEMTHKV
jgi:hypothetical protein